MNEPLPTNGDSPRVPLGGDYWDADPGAPLWGFADLHAHLMSHLAFGGNAMWGQPYDPEHPGPDGIQHALSSCAPIHGGLLEINPEFGHPAGGGWPDFIIWPRFTTLVHQQAYIDWIYRAYQGGLRLVTCLAVNNELLAVKSNPRLPTDDKSAIQAQVYGMKAMVDFIDRQCGGAGCGWMQIAYTPEQAGQIVAANRLAVILGVEVDSLGNWRKIEDLEAMCHGDLDHARQLIGLELDWLHGLGIRQITPIHLTNNAFGGTAIYMRFLETINLFVTGERWTVEDAFETGVRYRLDHDGVDLIDDVERGVAISGGQQGRRSMHRSTLVDHLPGARNLIEALEAPKVRGGHANARSLNPYGRILLEEMMKRGFIIDIDHMSEKATDVALEMAEQHGYPVICSHAWFRDLLFSAGTEFDSQKHAHFSTSDVHKVAHEAGKRGDQVERLSRLGGMVAPILNQGDIAGLRRALPELEAKIPEPCAGSSTSWAQAYLYAVAKTGGRGVAMGSDINGAACLPGPRFGTSAAFGARHDARRQQDRRNEIDCQVNGVAYTTPIRDYRWHRFEPSGAGAYDEQECRIWQAVAQYAAGFNPALHPHPPSDFPERSLHELLEGAEVRLHHEWIDHLTEGLWLAKGSEPVDPALAAKWPVEQRAAYVAIKSGAEGSLPGLDQQLLGLLVPDEHARQLVDKISAIWKKWGQMHGSNRPLQRCTAGERRDYDLNLDGMAHYGLLPDLLQDICNAGLSAQELVPLFRSAYDYIQMWTACEQHAAAPAG